MNSSVRPRVAFPDQIAGPQRGVDRLAVPMISPQQSDCLVAFQTPELHHEAKFTFRNRRLSFPPPPPCFIHRFASLPRQLDSPAVSLPRLCPRRHITQPCTGLSDTAHTSQFRRLLLRGPLLCPIGHRPCPNPGPEAGRPPEIRRAGALSNRQQMQSSSPPPPTPLRRQRSVPSHARQLLAPRSWHPSSPRRRRTPPPSPPCR